MDDEASIRLLTRMVLQPLGYDCQEAGDGEQTLALARTDTYDLVLLDLNLPGMDGYEICRQLRETPSSRHLKIIVVSGRGDQNALSEALPPAPTTTCPNPSSPADLEAKVQHAIRLKATQERVDLLTDQILLTNRQLEDTFMRGPRTCARLAGCSALRHVQDGRIGDGETPEHLAGSSFYTRCLAVEAAKVQDGPAWSTGVSSNSGALRAPARHRQDRSAGPGAHGQTGQARPP